MDEAAPLENSDAGSQAAETAREAVHLFDVDVLDWLPEWLEPSWNFMAEWPVVFLPVLIIVAYLLGRAIQIVLSNVIEKVTRRTPTRLDDKLVQAMRRPVLPTTVILALLVSASVMRLPDSLHNLTVRVLYTVLLLVWSSAAMRVAHIVLEIAARYRHQFSVLQPRTMPAFDMALKVLVVGAAAFLFLLIWGINPTAWLASAGVIGIAVGFAAKDTLANFFSGIFIIADAPYKIGDYIILDTGERGMVKQVGMRSTRILTRDDIEVTIPNAVIGNAKIINESGGPWEKERIRIPVGVAYGSDVDRVCELLVEIANAHEEVNETLKPRVRLRAFGNSSVDFELLCWIDHPEHRGRISHDLHMEVYKAFAREGIVIPFPQQDVHIRSMPKNPS